MSSPLSLLLNALDKVLGTRHHIKKKRVFSS